MPSGRAFAALRAATGETDGAMERHCVRQFLIAERLGSSEGFAKGRVRRRPRAAAVRGHAPRRRPVPQRDDGRTPTSRTAAGSAERTLAPFGSPPRRLARCLDAVEQHHALPLAIGLGRRGRAHTPLGLADVTGGLIAFGLPRSWLRELFRSVPRTGLYRMLARRSAGCARERPRTLAAHLRAAIRAHRLTQALAG